MPDYAVMEKLCDILQINVNELLSGERLPSQEYSKKAEENMMSLMQESSENYKQNIREWIGFLIGVVVLGFVKAFPLAMKKIASTEIRQLKKSLLAVKTAILTINVVGVMSFGIGVVSSFRAFSDATDVFGRYVLVAILSILYGLAMTLLLIPIYMRLKGKLIEE